MMQKSLRKSNPNQFIRMGGVAFLKKKKKIGFWKNYEISKLNNSRLYKTCDVTKYHFSTCIQKSLKEWLSLLRIQKKRLTFI